MSLTSRITRNFQITIPKKIREKIPYLKEGDPVEFQIKENQLIITLQKRIPADQLYYWTPEWQKDIQEAREDMKEGRVLGPFDDVEEALEALELPVENDE